MRDYDWSHRSTAQKVWVYVTSMLMLGSWLYFTAVISAHRIITWSDISWDVIWKLVQGFMILALFPLIVLPIVYAFNKKYPIELKHLFYREWARVYTGYGKGGRGGAQFFSEEILGLEIQKTHLRETSFYLVEIHFKPTLNYLGKGRREKVGIGVNREEELESLLEWTRARGIEAKFIGTDPSTSSG